MTLAIHQWQQSYAGSIELLKLQSGCMDYRVVAVDDSGA